MTIKNIQVRLVASYSCHSVGGCPPRGMPHLVTSAIEQQHVPRRQKCPAVLMGGMILRFAHVPGGAWSRTGSQSQLDPSSASHAQRAKHSCGVVTWRTYNHRVKKQHGFLRLPSNSSEPWRAESKASRSKQPKQGEAETTMQDPNPAACLLS